MRVTCLCAVSEGAHYSSHTRSSCDHAYNTLTNRLCICGQLTVRAALQCILQRNLTLQCILQRKVFWGAQTSTSISQIVIPNPLRAGESDVWRDDMRYHMCNHQWLLSMAYSDPLDPQGGPWGHRAMFCHFAMLLFLVVVVIKISIGRRPLPLYPIVDGSAGNYLGCKLVYTSAKLM